MSYEYLSFRMEDEFFDAYRLRTPDFGFRMGGGNTLGEHSWITKYARKKDDGSRERFWEGLRRVIEGMYSIQKDHALAYRLPWNEEQAHGSAQEAYDRAFAGKWSPPGRGYWMMGTELVNGRKDSSALQNCFTGDTRFLTLNGVCTLAEMAGEDVIVWAGPAFGNGEDGWTDGYVQAFGQQSVQRISFAPYGIRSNIRITETATPDHRWELRDGSLTTNLRVGDVVPAAAPAGIMDDEGFRHGLIFGDGSINYRYVNGDYSFMLRLCKEKGKHSPLFAKAIAQPSCDGDLVAYHRSATDMKSLPSSNDGDYLHSFILGWSAADGERKDDDLREEKSFRLTTQNQAAAEWLLSHAVASGFILLGHSIENTVTNYGPRSAPLHKFTLIDARNQCYWTVKSIEPLDEKEEVFCVVVPEVERFTLASGIYTSNCAFLSTCHLADLADPSQPFTRMMDMSMLGVGVGFDTRGAGKITLHQPSGAVPHQVADSREGWCEATGNLLRAFFLPSRRLPVFDYSKVRPAGSPIKGFGGIASGPAPLIKLHEKLAEKLSNRADQPITSTDITDIMNMVGKCVVSANVRRSAQIALGLSWDEEFLDLKDWNKNPERNGFDGWGHLSNNSVYAEVGGDYSHIASKIGLNGEPGLYWLDLAQQYGRLEDGRDNRDYRVAGINPCGEQPLENHELCVSGDTLLHTRYGLIRIEQAIGKQIDIWNGRQWSSVEPFYTGDRTLYRVTLSDGSHLDVTSNHEWIARRRTERTMKTVRTENLEIGMILPEFELADCGGNYDELAYEKGWFTGDGFMNGTTPCLLVQESEYSVLDTLRKKTIYPAQMPPGYTGSFVRVSMSGLISRELGSVLRDHHAGLPAEIMGFDAGSVALFAAAWIDTDGSVSHNPDTDHFVLYGPEAKLRDLQILLRRIGVNHSTLRLFAAEGAETSKGTRNYDLYRLLIPSYECAGIPVRIKKIGKTGSRYRVNNAHPEGTVIDAAHRQKVVSIGKISESAPTYCFSEPEKHQAVFGNVLTRQCTLVETYPTRCEDYADYKRTLKFAYLYGKSVTLLMTQWPETNEVMIRNRRIGLSMTGVAMFAEKHGWTELKRWQDCGYHTVRYWDKVYSEWLGVRESIKVTTVKPSGTVSLLWGVTPGVHWPRERGFYVRTVRDMTGSPFAKVMEEAGYPVEPSVSDPETTVVITFPVEGPDIRPEREVSIWEKTSIAAMTQRWWSDNAVSVTVTFSQDEAAQIPAVLRAFDGQLKSVSMLPMAEGTYAQAPYQRVSKEYWDELRANVKPVDWDSLYQDEALPDAEGELYCSNESCTI